MSFLVNTDLEVSSLGGMSALYIVLTIGLAASCSWFSAVKAYCYSGYFECDNGQCITYSRRCDGFYDCGVFDRSDELSCSGCYSSEFRCNNGYCILRSKVCDGYYDCGDNSDEFNCSSVFSRSTFCLPHLYEMPTPTSALNNIFITESEVYNALISLDPNKSKGPDGIGQKILKHCALAVYQPIHHLFCVSPSLKEIAIYTFSSRSSVVSLAVGVPLAVIFCIIIIIFFSIGGRSYNRRRLKRSRTAPVVETIPVYPSPVGRYSNAGIQQFKGDCPPPYTPPSVISPSALWTTPSAQPDYPLPFNPHYPQPGHLPAYPTGSCPPLPPPPSC